MSGIGKTNASRKALVAASVFVLALLPASGWSQSHSASGSTQALPTSRPGTFNPLESRIQGDIKFSSGKAPVGQSTCSRTPCGDLTYYCEDKCGGTIAESSCQTGANCSSTGTVTCQLAPTSDSGCIQGLQQFCTGTYTNASGDHLTWECDYDMSQPAPPPPQR